MEEQLNDTRPSTLNTPAKQKEDESKCIFTYCSLCSSIPCGALKLKRTSLPTTLMEAHLLKNRVADFRHCVQFLPFYLHYLFKWNLGHLIWAFLCDCCTLPDTSAHRIPFLAIRPLGRMSVIKFLCGLEIMKTILLFSLSPYLSSAVSLLFPRLFIPFGFTAGGTDSTLLTDTQTN